MLAPIIYECTCMYGISIISTLTDMHISEQLMRIFSIQWGETALHKASGAGQTAVITLLLDHGADVHAVDEVHVDDCSTVLMYLIFTLSSWLSSFPTLYIWELRSRVPSLLSTTIRVILRFVSITACRRDD